MLVQFRQVGGSALGTMVASSLVSLLHQASCAFTWDFEKANHSITILMNLPMSSFLQLLSSTKFPQYWVPRTKELEAMLHLSGSMPGGSNTTPKATKEPSRSLTLSRNGFYSDLYCFTLQKQQVDKLRELLFSSFHTLNRMDLSVFSDTFRTAKNIIWDICLNTLARQDTMFVEVQGTKAHPLHAEMLHGRWV